jgi:hypothetical protein
MPKFDEKLNRALDKEIRENINEMTKRINEVRGNISLIDKIPTLQEEKKSTILLHMI